MLVKYPLLFVDNVNNRVDSCYLTVIYVDKFVDLPLLTNF